MRFLGRNDIQFHIRSAKLEDASILSEIQNDHIREIQILDLPKSEDKIRIAIGSSVFGGSNFFVLEEDDLILGFIEYRPQNNNHVMLSYPYIKLNNPNRLKMQRDLIERTLSELKTSGYQFVSTQVSKHMKEIKSICLSLGFSNEKTIFQTYVGEILPDYNLVHDLEFRRVKGHDLDLAYSWIKRQLSPISPLYITKKNFARMIYGPKSFREGWSIAMENNIPVAFISSFIDANTDEIIIFGPFSGKNSAHSRIPLFNELMLYYSMFNKNNFRLMRIEPFDNDTDLFKKYNLELNENIVVITKKL